MPETEDLKPSDFYPPDDITCNSKRNASQLDWKSSFVNGVWEDLIWNMIGGTLLRSSQENREWTYLSVPVLVDETTFLFVNTSQMKSSTDAHRFRLGVMRQNLERMVSASYVAKRKDPELGNDIYCLSDDGKRDIHWFYGKK